MSLRLRATVKGKRVNLAPLPAGATFGELTAAVAAAGNLSDAEAAGMQVLSGFPPKALTLDAEDSLEGSVRTGESLRVVLGSDAKAPPEPKPCRKRRSPNPKPSGSASASKRPKAKKTGIQTLRSPAPPRRRSRPNPNPNPKPNPKPNPNPNAADSKADIADMLIAAASGGRGDRDKHLRSVYKAALLMRYEERQADSRLGAGLGGTYAAAVRTTTLSGVPAELEVTYRGGVGKTKEYIDIVEFIPLDTLKATMRLFTSEGGSADVDSANAREVLKPPNLARSSPRLFWNLLRHGGKGDVVEALGELLPDEDWSFLRVRRRDLSEKAKANLAQQQGAAQPEPSAAAAAAAAGEQPPVPTTFVATSVSAVATASAGELAAEAAAQRDAMERIFGGDAAGKRVLAALRRAKVTKPRDVALFCSSDRMLRRLLSKAMSDEEVEATLDGVAPEMLKAWTTAAKASQ